MGGLVFTPQKKLLSLTDYEFIIHNFSIRGYGNLLAGVEPYPLVISDLAE